MQRHGNIIARRPRVNISTPINRLGWSRSISFEIECHSFTKTPHRKTSTRRPSDWFDIESSVCINTLEKSGLTGRFVQTAIHTSADKRSARVGTGYRSSNHLHSSSPSSNSICCIQATSKKKHYRASNTAVMLGRGRTGTSELARPGLAVRSGITAWNRIPKKRSIQVIESEESEEERPKRLATRKRRAVQKQNPIKKTRSEVDERVCLSSSSSAVWCNQVQKSFRFCRRNPSERMRKRG
jgi:hypothetical protein